MIATIKLDQLPGGSRLFLDYLYDPHHVGAFFAWPFRSDREFEPCARLLDDHPVNRAAITAILKRQNQEFRAGSLVHQNIEWLHERWRAARMTTEFSVEVDGALGECYRPGVTMAGATSGM